MEHEKQDSTRLFKHKACTNTERERECCFVVLSTHVCCFMVSLFFPLSLWYDVCIVLDIFSNHPVPDCDLLIAADVLYSRRMGDHVGRRCLEVLRRQQRRNPPTKILVTDSQRFGGTDFVPNLNRELSTRYEWKERTCNFTGSGILVDEDQTYGVKARMLRL
mmetsp:Transcript_23231/g.53915  ORF Transcript_23231/g.53915 Transcript_23231/m.53915 type:complete len:162 (-) Transcript_23231:309-794(-)